MRPLFGTTPSSPRPPPNYTAIRQTVDGIETVRLTDARPQNHRFHTPRLRQHRLRNARQRQQRAPLPRPLARRLPPETPNGRHPPLAPFADRLDEPAFYANGRRYPFDRSLKNIHFDGHDHPIHGFLTLAADWQVTRLQADANGRRSPAGSTSAAAPNGWLNSPFRTSSK